MCIRDREGRGRNKTGTTLPVEAAIKTDMGGLRAEGGEEEVITSLADWPDARKEARVPAPCLGIAGSRPRAPALQSGPPAVGERLLAQAPQAREVLGRLPLCSRLAREYGSIVRLDHPIVFGETEDLVLHLMRQGRTPN